MPSIPSVVALAPIVLVPGEDVVATADVTALLPKTVGGTRLESVVSVEAISVSPSGLEVDDPGDATFDDTSISFWVDAAGTNHGASYTITLTFKSRATGGPGDGSEDRTRKAVCQVLIRERDLH